MAIILKNGVADKVCSSCHTIGSHLQSFTVIHHMARLKGADTVDAKFAIGLAERNLDIRESNKASTSEKYPPIISCIDKTNSYAGGGGGGS